METRVLRGHDGWVTTARFSPDGRTVVSAGADWSIRVWDTKTGRQLQVMEHVDGGTGAAFSPDGRLVASIGDYPCNHVLLWEAATGKERAELPRVGETNVTSVAFAPDRRTLAAGLETGEIMLWDVATGQEVRRLKGHQGPVTAVAYSRDGGTLVSGSWDGTALTWTIPAEARP
jgi:WD40 repeat protein